MSNKITSGEDGRHKLIIGVNAVADAVKVTMGAKGRNVIFEDELGNPQITKDGVSVAQTIVMHDKMENLGASLIKEAAAKTVSEVGDGTTATTVLVQAIINEGITAVNNGAHPILLKRGLEKAADLAIEYIQSVSKPADDREDLIKIATISANNDPEIGLVIADTVSAVGKNGIVTLEKGKGENTLVARVEGMQIDSGYSSHFLQTHPETSEAIYDNPKILLLNFKIQNMKSILHIVELAVGSQKPLVIIAEDIDGEVLTILTTNKVKNGHALLAINSPGVGANKQFILTDIAILTGGKVLNEDELSLFSADMLGDCSKIIAKNNQTVFVDGKGISEEIDARCKLISEQIKNSSNAREVMHLSKRLASMNNGLAIIYVGGNSETEVGEKLDRFDDALRATRAAQEEGFVAGGGSTLFLAGEHIMKPADDNLTEEEVLAHVILGKALHSPFKQIIFNAGIDTKAQVDLMYNRPYGNGFNVNTESFENLIEQGIIDPTKVLRVAIKNAVSIAGILLTTECVITRNDM